MDEKGFIELVNILDNKIKNLVATGNLTMVNDAGLQTIQQTMTRGEVRNAVPHVQEFGFASNAPVGSQTLTLFSAGERSTGTCLTVFNKNHKPNVSTGEAVLYNQFGQKITMVNGSVEILSPFVDIVHVNELDQPEAELRMNGVRVLTDRQASIPRPVDIATLYTAVNAIIDTNVAHGLNEVS